jgi:dTDP-glucose 4,6-dehydratase
MEKIFILGSNSFSGSYFIDYLLKKKKKIVGISRSKEKNKIFLTYKNSKLIKNFKFYRLNINNDLSKILNLIKKFKPDYIFNFAAQGMVEESWLYPYDWYLTNTLTQIKFLEEIKFLKFIKKYIQFSTPEVYGNCKNKIRENNFFNPSTPYANSRACADIHLLNLYKNYNFPAIITRTANVYGESQDIYRIVPKTIFSLIFNKKIYLDGEGKSVRSFIHIQDVCDALFKIMKKGIIGDTYHISTNKFISIQNLCNKICYKIKGNPKNIVLQKKDRMGKDQCYKLSSDKIRSKLYWKENISLEDGLEKTVFWFMNNLKKIAEKDLTYNHKK